MERTRDPLPALQCPRNQLFLQRRLYDLDRSGSGGIMLDGRTHLHFLESSIMIAVKYRDGILEPYFCLFTFAVDPDFISMNNKASLYRVHLIDEFQGFAG
ncbi:hypothetical protein TNCV_3177091 [Trichonephila clavipes]|nr:hypothetical protein TNCV_3177091 [Trichonephila clavipes]